MAVKTMVRRCRTALASKSWAVDRDTAPTGVETTDYALPFEVPVGLMPDPQFDGRTHSPIFPLAQQGALFPLILLADRVARMQATCVSQAPMCGFVTLRRQSRTRSPERSPLAAR
jgi:hypothetical protein